MEESGTIISISVGDLKGEFSKLPLEEINLSHLRNSRSAIDRAEVVRVFSKDSSTVKILKDRHTTLRTKVIY